MRKESILGLASAAVALPAIFSGCRSKETTPTPTAVVQTKEDFSKYIPLVVSVSPSADTCIDDTNEITYRSGEHIKLLNISNPGFLDFQISVENEVALFSREGSPYVGVVREGELFGVLNDPQGRGAQAIAKLLDVGPDSIKIAQVADCNNPQA